MSNDTPQTFEGGCACNAVRYRMTCEPMFVHCCHCTNCQRQSGSAFAVNAMIETSCVEHLQGDVEAVEVETPSGKGHKIVRCKQCRVAVWSHYGAAGDVLSFVRVGSLDEAAKVTPDIHIFTRSKQPWVVLPDDVPAVPVYYNSAEYWPESSISRMKALAG